MLKLQIKWASLVLISPTLFVLLSFQNRSLSEVENGKISQAHARSLIGLNKEQQDYFFQRIIKEDISVRKLEALLTEKNKRNCKR